MGTPEVRVLATLPSFLESVDASAPDDPAVVRLSPKAYGGDEPEYELHAASMLTEERSADRVLFLEGCDAVMDEGALTVEQAEAWLRVIGDARLALATRLGFGEPGWDEREMQDEPTHALVRALQSVQSELTATLMEFL